MIDGIHYARMSASYVSVPVNHGLPNPWAEIQDVEYRAFKSALPERSNEELGRFLDIGDLSCYIALRQNPELAADLGRLNTDQEFDDMTVTTATVVEAPDSEGQQLRKIVGYLYLANNVSGSSGWQRAIKKRIAPLNYVWAREIAVDPDYQNRGVARNLALFGLADRWPHQKVAAYVWEESTAMMAIANRLGMTDTGTEQKTPFGPETAPVSQHRFTIPVAELESKLAS